MNEKQITLLTDYRNQFYFSTKQRGSSVDLDRLKKYFEEQGYSLDIKNFKNVDFRNESYKDKFVLFQSSEDPELKYKDYIQDIVLGLHYQGAILIPSIYFFRAHHNKLFMEIVRDLYCPEKAVNIKSKGYGTYEDYIKDFEKFNDGSFVLKPDAGTRSKGVQLMKTLKQKRKYPFDVSRTFTLHNLKWAISKFFTGKPYVRQSNNRSKFIVQNFIDGLKGDYRVMIYGDKYYVLYRENRDNDFRASGSGKISFDIDIPDGLLEFSKEIYKKFDTPYISLDIGHKDGEFYLFEFQFMCLGQYVIEKSKWFYENRGSVWKRVYEDPDLEREVSNSIVNYLENKIDLL